MKDIYMVMEFLHERHIYGDGTDGDGDERTIFLYVLLFKFLFLHALD